MSDFPYSQLTLKEFSAMNTQDKIDVLGKVRERDQDLLDSLFADESVHWALLSIRCGKVVQTGGKNQPTDAEIDAIEARLNEPCAFFSRPSYPLSCAPCED